MRVYRLIAVEAAGHAANGVCDAHEKSLGVFSSAANAEAMIRIHAGRVKGCARVLGYALYENELDDLAMHGPWNAIPAFLSVGTYLADGTLNAFCDCDDACEKQWHGRDAATIRFKEGDFVSVWSGRTIKTELVGMAPHTFDKGFIGDWTDDCYLTYDTEGHNHPFAPYVFPLVGKVAAGVKAKLEATREREEPVE